ncbi:MAG: ABC transporter permease subunit [Anaerolineae bacterium]|nr:ABC transporter permease subunit [Anaerolineae bacterium]
MASSTTSAQENIASLQQEAEETLRYKTLLQKATWRIRHDPLTMTAIFGLVLLAALCFAAPLIVRILDVEYNNNDPYSNRLPPGARVADSDTTAIKWNGETGAVDRVAIGHNDTVLSVAFSPDGEMFATASIDGTVRLWRTGIAGFIRVVNTHEAAVTAVIFHPAGEWFLTASEDGTARLWEVEKLDPTAPDDPVLAFAGHAAGLTGAAFSPDGALLLTGSEDGTARLWDVATGDERERYGQLADEAAGIAAVPVTSVAFTPDGAQIMLGDATGQVQVIALDGNDVVATLDGHTAAVTSIAISPDGTRAVTASEDGTARVWDFASGESQLTFTGHTAAVNSVFFSADGTHVLSASADGTTLLWDPVSGEIVQTFDEMTYPVHTAAISPDGTSIITGTEGRRRFYLLGTDGAGRDMVTRLLYGGQVSLKIGFFSAIGSITIGVLLGITAGFYRGIFDDVVMWIITTLNSIPQLFLLLIISAMLAPNENSLILVLVFLGWTGSTRIVRGETFALREREFIVAARAIGASSLRIMFVHIMPNVISVLLIVLTRAIGGLILTESALSFLGFGVKPPTPTWGNMLTGGLDLLRDAPHLVFAPGLLISLTVLCLYVIGDGLRDAFDPRISD